MMPADIVQQLDPIFKAKSVAFIGASKTPGKWGYRAIERAINSGYRGRMYPVNPGGGEILGLKAYPDVLDIPRDVDLAVFTLPAEHMPAVMRSCVQKGIKGGVVITADFAETGDHGRQIQDEIVRIARKGGMRFIGPNGMGIWTSAVWLNFALEPAPKPGPLAFVSQSGTFGGSLAHIANIKGYGLSKFVSIGNQADLKIPDLLEYLAEDPDTKVIVLYVEGVMEGRRFLEVARRVVQRKPILVYKGGASPEGARATLSHTASIAGSNAVFDAMCRQAGILKAREVEHLFVMAEALISQPLPRSNRIAVIGSGGQGVVTVDALSNLGMRVPALDDDARRRIKEVLPPHAPVPGNPVDFAGGARTALQEARVAEQLAQLDYIDGIITNVPTTFSLARTVGAAARVGIEGAELLASIPEKYGKPILTQRFRAHGEDLIINILQGAGIPYYTTPEESALAMFALVRYGQIRSALEDTVGVLDD
jgi:acyl-CoA synthetase (NDP forming)